VINVDAIHAATTPLGLAVALGLDVARGARDERVRVRHHGEAHPSCDIARRDGRIVWACRSCSTGGDIISLAADVWGYSRHDFRTVALRLGELLGVRVEDTAPGRATAARPMRDPVVDVATRLDAMADDWLAGRAMRPADLAAVDAAGVDVGLEALGLLRAVDEAERAEDERRADALDAMADDVLAKAKQRETVFLGS
jgi:ribosomal protein S14